MLAGGCRSYEPRVLQIVDELELYAGKTKDFGSLNVDWYALKLMDFAPNVPVKRLLSPAIRERFEWEFALPAYLELLAKCGYEPSLRELAVLCTVNRWGYYAFYFEDKQFKAPLIERGDGSTEPGIFLEEDYLPRLRKEAMRILADVTGKRCAGVLGYVALTDREDEIRDSARNLLSKVTGERIDSRKELLRLWPQIRGTYSRPRWDPYTGILEMFLPR